MKTRPQWLTACAHVFKNHTALAILATAIFLSFAIFSAAQPFSSVELAFTDDSEKGLAIVPASCPSSPHYGGECSAGGDGTTCYQLRRYSTAGTHTFTVPNGVTTVYVKMWGAGGGSTGASGGAGGYTGGVLTVTPGESLSVIVGSPTGGGNAILGGGKGGGYSGMFRGSVTQSGALLIAGGGGGAGGPTNINGNQPGGAGGGASGQNSYGGGGTQTAGGVGSCGNIPGHNGSALAGGNAMGGSCGGAAGSQRQAGGGGAGWFGGGGAHSGQISGGGGGGGSGYCGSATNCTTTAGVGATPGNDADTQRMAGAGRPNRAGYVRIAWIGSGASCTAEDEILTCWNGSAPVNGQCPACPEGYTQSGFQCIPPAGPEFVPFATTVGWQATGHLEVRPTLVRRGETANVYWKVENVRSCTVTGTNGDSWNATASGASGRTSGAINGRTTYTLNCQSLVGATPASITEVKTVNIIPVFDEQ